MTEKKRIYRKTGAYAKKQPAPSMAEVASAADDIYLAFTPRLFNPDRLAAKKGGLTIYKQMREDDQVKACLRLKKAATTTSGWDIEGENEEHVKFLTFIFAKMEGTVEGMIGSILSAFDYGFSVHEKVFNYIDIGPYQGKIGIESIRAKSPTRITFDTDGQGRVKPNGLLQRQDNGKSTPLPIDKFIIYTYQKEFDNYYGESDLKAAYRAYFVKQNVLRYWAVYLEKFSMPITKGTVSSGKITQPQLDSFKELMQRIQSGMSILTPTGMDISLLESQRIDRGVFSQAIESLNIAIARAILIPQMIGLVPQAGSGSYAKGDIELKMFDWILKEINTNTQEVINEQLVRQLIDINFGEQQEYPQFIIKPLREEDKQKLVSTWSELVARGAATTTQETEEYLREMLNFPEMTEEEKSLVEKASRLNIDRFPPELSGSSGLAGGNPSGGKNKMSNIKGKQNQYAQEKTFAQRTITGPEARANFEAIEADLDRIEEKGRNALSQAFEETIYAMIRDAQKKLESPERIVLPDAGKIKAAIKTFAEEASEAAIIHAEKELGLQPRTYRQRAFFRKVDQIIADYAESRAFEITGLAKQEILDKAKEYVTQFVVANKEPYPTEEMIAGLTMLLEDFLPRKDASGRTVAAATRAALIARTNVSDIFNNARFQVFNTSELSNFVKAFLYSAIIDGRTTQICRELNGRIFTREDLDGFIPPNHFQCRSILVPVTEQDKGWEEVYTKQAPIRYAPQEGFGQ